MWYQLNWWSFESYEEFIGLLIPGAALQRSSNTKMSWKYAASLQENTHAVVRFHTSAWVFSRKFAVYFQNAFSGEHLWRNSSVTFTKLCRYFFMKRTVAWLEGEKGGWIPSKMCTQMFADFLSKTEVNHKFFSVSRFFKWFWTWNYNTSRNNL